MTISQSGEVLTDTDGDIFTVGATATGNLAITGGSQLLIDNVDGHTLSLGQFTGSIGNGLVSGTGSNLTIDGGANGSNFLIVGENGSGNFRVDEDASVDIAVPRDNYDGLSLFLVGWRSGSSGLATFDNASLVRQGSAAIADIGRESVGTLIFANGATDTATATDVAVYLVGAEAGGRGSLSITSGSSVSLRTDNLAVPGPNTDAESQVTVGRNGGFGTVSLDDGTLDILSSAGEAGATLGRGEGSSGRFNVLNGSTLTIDAAPRANPETEPLAAFLDIGLLGGRGRLSASQSDISLQGRDSAFVGLGLDGGDGFLSTSQTNISIASEGLARMVIGGTLQPGAGGTGVLDANVDTSLSVVGDEADILVGASPGTTGTLVAFASTIDVEATGETPSRISIGGVAGSTGIAQFLTGSTRVNVDNMTIGSDPQADETSPNTGYGEVTIGLSAVVTAQRIDMGRNSTLKFDTGFVSVDYGENLRGLVVREGVIVHQPGSVAIINGNIDFDDETEIIYQVSNTAPLGRVEFTAHDFRGGDYTETIQPLYDRQFTAGETMRMARIDLVRQDVNQNFVEDFQVLGQSAGFAYMKSGTYTLGPSGSGGTVELDFTALSNSDGTGQMVVAPGAAGLTSVMLEYDGTQNYGEIRIGSRELDSVSEAHQTMNATRFAGSLGDDDLSVIGGSDGVEFYGHAGFDNLTGGMGDDFLDGGSGADVMVGGAGNDVFQVDDLADIVTELADEGDDIVDTTISLTIPVNVEVLRLQGAADIDGTGSDSRDVIQGNSGSNIINGAGGFDVMAGGAGNDVYAVDNSLDAVIEAVGEGYDNVYSSIDFIISEDSEIESVLLTGNAVVLRGSSTNNQIFGNDVVNVLDGRGGIDYLLGFGGGDIFQITSGDDGEDVIGDFSRTDADRIAFAGFDSSNTTVTHEGDGLFTIADATAGTSQTFQLRDGYGIDAYTSGDLVEGQDYYFA